MFQIHDLRETRVYQEAKEEGRKEGIEKGVTMARLLAENKSTAEIAAILELDVELVRQVLTQLERD